MKVRGPDSETGFSTVPARWQTTESHGLIRAFRLVVVEGPDVGKTFVSDASSSERAVIGTHETANLVLQDRSVSRFHCEVSIAGEQLLVKDLESKNGTEIAGVSILAARLKSGTVLRLGDTRVRCDLGIDHVKVPLSEKDQFGLLVGKSPPMRALFATLEVAAGRDTTILVEGETGTGKEALAESIHRESPRRDGPFVVVDCAGVPGTLLEAELFGHERGAFTGANRERAGVFELASGGTIFLDEIGELAADLQPTLLRVLERREVKRIGSDRWLPVDVRVIAATNRDLKREVNAGRFRSDLYYRLAVLRVRMPSLRERPDDLPLHIRTLLDAVGAASSPEGAMLLSPEAISEIERHEWPGNVRELRNYVERCLTLKAIAPTEASDEREDVDALCDPRQPLKVARDRWNRTLERRYAESLLASHDGNIAAAARAAGVDRSYLYRVLWKHGMR